MRRIGAIVLALSAVTGAGVSGAVYAQQSSASPGAVVQAHVDAYAAADFDAFMATFASNAVVIFDGQRYSGTAQIRRIYSANFLQGAPQMYIADSRIEGNQVILEEGYTFDDGTYMCCSNSTFTVTNGKISKVVVLSPQ